MFASGTVREAGMFRDRRDAGRALGQRLAVLAGEHPVVIALPRGGVPVGYEVARTLEAPLDVLVARKLGAPGNPEYGIGAVAEGGVCVLNERAVRMLQLTAEELEHAVARAERELKERLERYRAEQPAVPVSGQTVILVDDGLATGGTARAALRALHERGAARLILAVPVATQETAERLARECDEVVCLLMPHPMLAVGHWYERFGQTTDEEVCALLAASRPALAGSEPGAPDPDDPPDPPDPPVAEEVRIAQPTGQEIVGDLVAPAEPAGVVVFAHGSGSSRRSPRNRDVAAALNRAGFATLLIDLLTAEEERWRANVFDIDLLSARLGAATAWVRRQPRLARLGLGYFGASTGAGSALWAAADLGADVQAVVSRGGRPDLAARRLHRVLAPTLLIVGGEDPVVIELNRVALGRLRCEASLEIVPGATHLFEEPGALEQVARLAVAWFERHLKCGPGSIRARSQAAREPDTRGARDRRVQRA